MILQTVSISLLACFSLCVTPSALPQQMPSSITLFSISRPFCSSGLYSLFCFIFFAPAQSIPQLPVPPQAISHSITFTSCSTKCLISTSVVILISVVSLIFFLFSTFSTTFRHLLLFSLSHFYPISSGTFTGSHVSVCFQFPPSFLLSSLS